MASRNFFLLLLSVIVVATGTAAEPFAPGQIWTYETRRDESVSRVLVVRVDEYPKHGRIIHVAVQGLSLRRTNDGAPESWGIRHSPITEAALSKSVRRLESTSTPVSSPAGFDESYATWKRAAEGGKVQFWTLPVRDIVRQMEQWIREGRR